MLKKLSATLLSAATAAMLLAAPSFAQSGSIGLELNATRASGEGCRLIYVVTNSTGTEFNSAAYEVALFDSDGVVTRLLVLEFGPLQAGKTKVMQFELPENPCEQISRLLVNTVTSCVASDGSEANCLNGLVTSSRGDIQFGI